MALQKFDYYYYYYSKTYLWPSYCQISTDLDKILHTPIVVRNTPVGRLSPSGLALSRPCADRGLCFFVIIVTHPKSYIETTDRRDFGGRSSKWRWGRVLSWTIPEFCSVGGARSKTAFFAFLWYPLTILRTAYRKQFYRNQWYRWKAETLKVCLLLIWRVWPGIWQI